jgi:hypothetical protein
MNFTDGILKSIRDLTKRVDSLETIGRAFYTRYGGYAVKLIAGENLAEGEVVQITQGAGGATMTVFKNAVNSDMPMGVCYAAATLGNPVYVVVAGVGYVLPNPNDAPTRGYVIYSSSSTAGRVDQANAVPAVATHIKEVGHWLETAAGGVKARAIIHFN